MRQLIKLLSLFLVTVSCEKDLSFEVPVPEPRAVLDAKVYTNDSVLAYLSTSEYYLKGDDYEYGLDTSYVVHLYKDGDFIERLEAVAGRTKYQSYYSSKHRPTSGSIYTVKASKTDLPNVEGSTLTPLPVPISEIIWDTTSTGIVKMSVSFEDPPGKGNKYLLTSSVKPRPGLRKQVIFRTIDPSLHTFKYNGVLEVENEEPYGTHFFLEDESFNGQIKTTVLELVRLQSDNWPDELEGIQVNLFHISEEWFDHEESKFNHYKSIVGVFSEPARVYSNVNDGLGIVGSGTAYTYFYKF